MQKDSRSESISDDLPSQSAGAAEKPRRYVALDGMRGIAAGTVILFHAAASVAPDRFRPHFGFLAVDLFFVLSGFVLAYNYDRRFAQGMKPSDFMRRRFIRLYPLFALGLFLGLGLRIVPAIRDAATTGGAMTGRDMLLAVTFNAFFLPAPGGLRNDFIFPADLPAWSLFFELWVANLAFAYQWKQLHGCRFAVFIGVMALLGLASEAVFHTWDVGALWRTFLGGFARVGFSFMVGIALARFHALRPPRLHVHSWLLWGAVAAAMFVPFSHDLGHVYELFCVFVLFPLLVYIGAEAEDRHPAVGSALGEASYAAYTLHVPLLSLLCFLAPAAVAHPSELYGIAFAVVVLGISLPIAYFYDEPARAALAWIFRAPGRSRAAV